MLEGFYFARFEQIVILDIQQDLLDRALRFPKSFFDGKEVGYLMSRLSSDVQGLRWFFSSTLVYLMTHTLRLLGGHRTALLPRVAISARVLLTLPPFCSARLLRAKIARFRPSKHGKTRECLAENAGIAVGNHADQVVCVRKSSEVNRVVSANCRLHSTSRWNRLRSIPSPTWSVNTLPDVTRMVVIIAGAYLIVQGNWSVGSLLAFQSYLGYVHTPARYLANIGLQIQNAIAALERVSALYDIVPEEDNDAGMIVTRLDGAVDFRSVTFAYDADQPVLQDISFSVPAGGHVAIVGPSGVGKTTLVSLLLRFYQPGAGDIAFDGRPATDYNLRSLRQRIGYVTQGTLLLSGTIADNLHYGNPDASDEQVIRAAKAAGIHDFIANLPDGYQATVGERGVNLSEGQRQRLSIARALIRNPDILVMDEPTSALDSVTEKSIFDALPELVRTRPCLSSRTGSRPYKTPIRF